MDLDLDLDLDLDWNFLGHLFVWRLDFQTLPPAQSMASPPRVVGAQSVLFAARIWNLPRIVFLLNG